MRKYWWMPLPFAPLATWYVYKFFFRLYEPVMVATGFKGEPDYFFVQAGALVSTVITAVLVGIAYDNWRD